MQVILSSEQLSNTIRDLAAQLNKTHPDLKDVIFVGIQQGGVILANDIIGSLKQMNPSGKIQYGQLDITFYRDDIRKEILAPDTMNLPFAIENKTVVLIDRNEHRQFPIQADYVGLTVKTNKTDKVKLVDKEVVLITQ